MVMIRDVTSTKTLKYKYKYEYLFFIVSTYNEHERRCKQKLWNCQSSSETFIFFKFSLMTQAQLYDDIVCGAY